MRRGSTQVRAPSHEAERELALSLVALLVLIGEVAVGCSPVPADDMQERAEASEMSIKRVQFERTGGFAGLRLAVDLNIDSLSAAEADELRRLVEGARFFELPSEVVSPAEGADQFVYKLTVESADRSHTVEVAESAVPETLRPLIDWLTAAARRRRGERK